MLKVAVANPEMRFTTETDAAIRRVMSEFYGPDSENVRRIRAFRRRPGSRLLERLQSALLPRFLEGKHDGLRARLRKCSSEQRKERGENYLDIVRTLDKLVALGASDPARTTRLLERYGLVDFLDAIGERGRLAPLG